MVSLGRMALTCLLSILVMTRTAPAFADPQSHPSTEQHYQTGREAALRGDWDTALRELNAAWKLEQTGRIAGLLGQAELYSQQYAAAATHLRFALANMPADAHPSAKTRLEEWFAEAKENVGIVIVKAPRGAEVFVDNVSIGDAPVANDVFVEPGVHSVEARKDQRLIGTKTVQVEAKSTQEVQLAEFESKLSPPTTTNSNSPFPRVASRGNAHSERSAVPGYVGLALGGAAIISGGAFFLLAESDANDVDRLKRRTGRSGCVNGSASEADCKDLQSAAESHDSRMFIGSTLLVAGGVAGAASLAYLLWPSGEQNVRASAGFDPSGATVVVSGRF